MLIYDKQKPVFLCGSNKLKTYCIGENHEFIFKFKIKINPHFSTRLENILLPDTAKKAPFYTRDENSLLR